MMSASFLSYYTVTLHNLQYYCRYDSIFREVTTMANRPNLKNRTAYTSTLSTPLWEALNALQQSSRIPKSKLLDEAVELLLQHHQQG
jgi:hypothetical protein